MISVIIPARNESCGIEKTLQSVAAQKTPHEIIVADGYSTDNTVKKARQYATVVNGVVGRSAQMNRAAREARGEYLLFLHADTILPPHALEMIAGSNAEWGAFHHAYDTSHPFLKFVAWRGNMIRLHLFHIPYGDQAIFVRRSLFETLGGFPSVPLMEDVLLAQTLREHCPPIVITTQIITSARRFTENGMMKTYLNMGKILFMFHVLKKSPEQIAHLYP